jgi:mannitol-1-/sugar-/sorbitol-6-/2-deoxyglucose-6-phosphatase
MNLKLSDFDAVIFDMDGVLIDSEPLWKIAMEEVFASLGSKLLKKDFEKTVGLRIDEVIHFWNKHENWGIVDENQIAEKIISKMEILISQNPQALDGVLQTLAYLQQRKLKIGLATSSSSRLINIVLRELKIQHYFHVACSAETENYGKPHPAVYLKVAEELKVSPTKCLVIEDSYNGVIAGLAAQMKVVCIPEKTHMINSKLKLADFSFDSMSDFYLEIKNN